jgi:Domain of unknown function (DUF1788)
MLQDTVETLYLKLRNPNFLSMKGLSGEVPIFVHTYEATEEDTAVQTAHALATRLNNDGIACAHIDLFDVVLGQLEAEGRLGRILEKEAQLGKEKLFEMMTSLTDPKTRLVPRLMQWLETANAKLSILTGVGRVYPFLRTHTILDSLQPAMTRQPVVMFFPGHYTQEQGIGSQLRLFGSLPAPLLYRPYYRAFNLAHYRV